MPKPPLRSASLRIQNFSDTSEEIDGITKKLLTENSTLNQEVSNAIGSSISEHLSSEDKISKKYHTEYKDGQSKNSHQKTKEYFHENNSSTGTVSDPNGKRLLNLFMNKKKHKKTSSISDDMLINSEPKESHGISRRSLTVRISPKKSISAPKIRRGKHKKSISDLFRPKSQTEGTDPEFPIENTTAVNSSIASEVQMNDKEAEELKNTLREISRRIPDGLPVDMLISYYLDTTSEEANDSANSIQLGDDILDGLENFDSNLDENLKSISVDLLPGYDWIVDNDREITNEFMALSPFKLLPEESIPLEKLESLSKDRDQLLSEIEKLKVQYEKESKFRNASLRLLKLYSSKAPTAMNSSFHFPGKSVFQSPPVNISSPMGNIKIDVNKAAKTESSSPTTPLEQSPICKPIESAIQATTEAYFTSTNSLTEISGKIIQLYHQKEVLENCFIPGILRRFVGAYGRLKGKLIDSQTEKTQLLKQNENFERKLRKASKWKQTPNSAAQETQDEAKDDVWIWMLRDERVRRLCDEVVHLGGTKHMLRRA